ncbi:hypothetical protein X798_08206, partial [Onchocerca flexuosa]
MAKKYGVLLMIQIGMISLDFIFNILTFIITTNDAVQLMLHLLQDTLIVLSIIVILIAFSSTFVFQAGLITLLLSKFASTIIVSSVYLALSILYHFYDMLSKNKSHNDQSRMIMKCHIIKNNDYEGSADKTTSAIVAVKIEKKNHEERQSWINIYGSFQQQYYIISHTKGPYYCYQTQYITMIRNGFASKYVEKINSVELCI